MPEPFDSLTHGTGKAVVAQNAIKHGLSAEREILSFEDRGEYERHKEKVLKQLKPVGYIEEMLAQRIVSLYWRMQRADRMQNAVVEYLAAKRVHAGPSLNLVQAFLAKKAALPQDNPAVDAEHPFGRIMAKDFHEELILDRMEMYERRIESSSHKTMTEFHKWRLMRQMEEEEVSSVKCEVSSEERVLQTSNSALHSSPATPHGVTANGVRETKPNPCDEGEGVHGTRDGSKARETKPNLEGQGNSGEAQTALAGAKTQRSARRDGGSVCETKPTCVGEAASSPAKHGEQGRACGM